MSSLFNTALWGGGGAAAGDPSTTARDMIHLVFRMLCVLRPGQTGYDEAIAECFTCLNQMLDSWSTERLAVYAIARNVYDLTANQQLYTIGFGGNFDNVRPPRIEAAGFLTASVESPTGVLSLDQYRNGVTGVYVTGDSPLANVWVNPTPIAGQQLALYTWQPFEMFADLDTPYSFPFGYTIAMRYALAIEYAPLAQLTTKGQALLPMLERQAARYKGNIKRLNNPKTTLQCDSALVNIGSCR